MELASRFGKYAISQVFVGSVRISIAFLTAFSQAELSVSHGSYWKPYERIYTMEELL